MKEKGGGIVGRTWRNGGRGGRRERGDQRGPGWGEGEEDKGSGVKKFLMRYKLVYLP